MLTRLLILRLAFLAFLAALCMLMFPSVAAAAVVDPGDTVASIGLSALSVTLLVSVFIPIVTGIVTKLNTSGQIKGLVTLVLNLINAAVVGAITSDGSSVFSEETIIAALVGMAISVASYLGFYKPVDMNAKLGPTKGI